MGRDALNTAAATQAVLSATPVHAAPAELRPSAPLAGDSAGAAAVGRLRRIMTELKQEAETRLDDLEAAWLTKEDFDHISR